jgi:hypothetical protein
LIKSPRKHLLREGQKNKAHGEKCHALYDPLGSMYVKRRKHIVQQNDGGVRVDCSSKGDTSFLATAQRQTLISELEIHS